MSLVAGVLGIANAGVTNDWNQVAAPGGNTPDTAYAWSDAGNWEVSAVPMARGDGARLGTSAKPRFIRLPGGLFLTHVDWGSGNFILGDVRFCESSDGQWPARNESAMGSDTIHFGDLYLTSDKSMAYAGVWSVAGRFVQMGQRDWGRTGGLRIRMDLWADSSEPMRTPPLESGQFLANGSFTFFGPRGAPAQTGTFDQTADSPYVKTSDSAWFAAGAVVTGTGIPEGTFVKAAFPQTGWLELSRNAMLTKAGNPLTFEAITPSVEQLVFREHSNIGRDWRIRAIKFREEDGLRLVYAEVVTSQAAGGRRWGLTADERAGGWIPGDIVISNVSWTTAFVQTNTLCAARLELPNVLDGHWICGTDCDSRLTVPAGRTGGLLHVRDFMGTLEKCGDGRLELGVDATTAAGTFRVTEGVARIASSTSFEGQPLTLGTLALAAGATLELPSEGLLVSNLVAASGARVQGPGTLTVLVGTEGMPSVAGGANLVVPAVDLTRACVPQDGQWLHLDATAEETLALVEENGTNFVSRWNDVGGRAVSARAYKEGQDRFGRPWLRDAGFLGRPYIDLGPVVTVMDKALTGPMRGLQFYTGETRYHFGESGGEVAVPAIRAAFFMAGSEYGGGSLLAAAWGNYMNYGFVHRESTDFSTAIVSSKVAPNLSRFGGGTTFAVNGVRTDPLVTPFSGGWDVFAYTATGDWMKSGGLGICCAIPGTTESGYDNCYGGLLYGEVILYTNQLTKSQVALIEAYLQHKWRGVDVPGLTAGTHALRLDGNATISVVGGGAVEVTEIGGSGSLDGNLVIGPNGVVDVVIGDDRTVPTVTVKGMATLPAKMTVRVSGRTRKLRGGDYVVLCADQLVGADTEWTVESPTGDRRTYVAEQVGNTVVLRVRAPGFAVFVR